MRHSTATAGVSPRLRARSHVRALRAAIERVAVVVRRIIGVPDYDVYVRHMRAHHPGCRLMTPREFEQQRLTDRYNRPGSRCC